MSKNQNNPKNLGKIYRIMEIFWLIVAVGTVAATTYIFIVDGFEVIYAILPLLALTFWFMRRRIRKSYERMDQKENNDQ